MFNVKGYTTTLILACSRPTATLLYTQDDALQKQEMSLLCVLG